MQADTTAAPKPVTDAAGPEGTEEQDLSVFVQNLLTQMQSRFQQMSEAIVTRIDDMGDRIDGLEKSITELMDQTATSEDAQQVEGGPPAVEGGEAPK